MGNSRIALVANDQRVAAAIQTTLKKNLKHPALPCSAENIRELIDLDNKGILLLVSTDAATADQCRWLIQEIRLRKLTPTVILIDGEEGRGAPFLEGLAPYVAMRVRWPHEEPALVDGVRRHLVQCQPIPSIQEETLEERICRMIKAQTPSLLPLAKPLALAAAHDVTILLTGETGSGKTFLARLIHDCSPRKQDRFMTVACGALASNLLESEFFGHVRGSFTGAEQAKLGKFAAVGNGTLLLDEIDVLSLEHQTKLLRVIETGEYEPVGCNETHTCNARIIAASNWNIAEAVEQGKFRRDLYYRLNVMAFYLPPLRERVADIEPLVRGMVARFATKFGKTLYDIAPETFEALKVFSWPGNLRQLENVIQQAVLVSTGTELLAQHLPALIQEHASRCEFKVRADPPAPNHSLSQSREAYERTVIRKALQDAGYSRTRAASILGVSRVTLYKKMKKYGLADIPTRAASILAPPVEADTSTSVY
jgi:two-component system response regulator HydG